MLKNYIKLAFRNFRKHLSFSLINAAGLAVGMACCILIMLFVLDELSFDRFHENHDRIYRVTRKWFNEDGVVNLHLGHVAPPIGPLLKSDFPELSAVTRLHRLGRLIMGNGTVFFEEAGFFFAEPELFDIFSFEMTAGDPATALRDPFSMVITEAAVEKYFGGENPMGKSLSIRVDDQGADMMITGITKPMPHNSHFHADFLGSFSTYEAVAGQEELQNWMSNNFATYLLLPEHYDVDKLKAGLDPFIDRHMSPGRSEITKLELQRLTDIHLRSHLDSELEANSDIMYVTVFSLIALFILLIACVNFMNLSTARSAHRAREVGMRRVAGAHKKQLIPQFLSESVLMAFFSLLAALAIVLAVLPAFNRFVERDLSLNILGNGALFLGLFVITVFVGLVSGIYPALFLSSFKPVRVLKGDLGRGKKAFSFRTVLVVFQFATCITLIICVGVVSGQLDFMRSRELGFDEEHVVVLPGSSAVAGNLESFKSRLLRNPGVLSVSAAKRVPSGRLLDSAGARVLSGGTSRPVSFRIAQLRVDADYIPTFRMEMAAGRNFSKQMGTDFDQAFILNEAAVRRIGWISPEEAVGQGFGYGRRSGKIIGVVRDFHFESLHQEIAPIVMFLSTISLDQIAVRISPQNIPRTLAFLQEVWAEVRPDYPFSYYFIDENFDRLYRSEEKLQSIFSVFAFLSVFIGCLGLFGLAAYSAERRTREIGIRKVLGASTPGIAFLLSREFTKWVLLSNVIAWPLAYVVMARWLRNFAYRAPLDIGMFFLSGVLAWAVAFLTVGYQALKASATDPAVTLKYE